MSRPRLPLGFRALLAVLPRTFRQRYGADLAATFEHRRADARRRGRLAAAAFWWRSTIDVARTALAERRRSSLDLPASPHVGSAGQGEGVMAGLSSDARFAIRQVRRQPSQAAFVVLTLAIGIGATTAVFSVVSGVLLKPLPYAESDRLLAVWGRFLPESGFDFPQFPLSVPEYVDYRDHTRALEGIALFQNGSATVGTEDRAPERVLFAALTPNTLRLLRVPVAHGRDFTDADGVPGAPPVAILSHGYWTRRYGGEPAVIGRSIEVSGVNRTIVGIAPERFGFPSPAVAIWRPLTIDPADPGNRQGHSTNAIARLANGVSIDAAHAELAALMQQWKIQYPDIHTGHFLFVRPLLEDVVGTVSQVLIALFAATAFLLLIVCANVSNMLLARGEGRAREMAIRTALGAERRRLIRLAGFESLLLAAAGGLAGIGVAWATVEVLKRVQGAAVPRLADVGIDSTVLAFGAGATVLATLLFGTVPAIRSSVTRPGLALRSDDRTASSTAARLRMRRGLVAAEVALTVVLAIGAGLMVRSLRQVLTVDPGFNPEGIVLASLSLPPARYSTPDKIEPFYQEVLDRLRRVPGVTAVSASSSVPIFSGVGVWDFQIEGRPEPAAGAPAWNAAIGFVRPGYFDVLGIPIRRGRAVTADDDLRRPPVVVINESLATKYFAGEDPIGRQLRVAGGPDRPWATIVGIVGDVRDQNLETPARPIYYMAHAQMAVTAGSQVGTMAIMANTGGGPDGVSGALRQIVHSIDPSQAIFGTTRYVDAIGGSYAARTFATALFGVFAVLGLVLGATGISAVLAYSVARLTPEIGIRRALGATSGRILLLVMRQGLVPAGVGLTAGLFVSAVAGRWLESQLFGIPAIDVPTYLAVAGGVLVLVGVACLLPARRALRVHPISALRAT